MSAAADNPPPPPPRSRARGTPTRQKRKSKNTDDVGEAPDSREDQDVFADAPSMNEEPAPAAEVPTSDDAADLGAVAKEGDADGAAKERDAEVEELRKQLADAVSVRDDVMTRHTDWLKEREELRGELDSVRLQLESERTRAEAAEERVRDLRRTNEESRRAIMRLQQMSRPGTPRSDTESPALDKGRKPSTMLSSLTPRSLSGASEGDSESERPGLRDLRLKSPSQTAAELAPASGLGLKIDEADETGEEAAKAEPSSDETVGGTAPAPAPAQRSGLFPTGLLRPSLNLLRKNAPGEGAGTGAVAGAQDDSAEVEHLRADHEKLQADLGALQKQLAAIQDQLAESHEAQQASETLIKSLREYIVASGASVPLSAPASREAPAAPPRTVPTEPTDDAAPAAVAAAAGTESEGAEAPAEPATASTDKSVGTAAQGAEALTEASETNKTAEAGEGATDAADAAPADVASQTDQTAETLAEESKDAAASTDKATDPSESTADQASDAAASS